MAALLLATVAHAQVSLNAARIGAENPESLAKFYESAFGMQEVNRIGVPGGAEIFLNFGASLQAAKANKSVPIVIMHRPSNDLKDPVPHLVLNVTNMDKTVAALKAAGGSMATGPMAFGHTGIMIGIAVDPAGNRIEMIQRPSH